MSAKAPHHAAHPVQPGFAGEPLRFLTLDGVRFLAFLAVFLSHALPVVLRDSEQNGVLSHVPLNFASLANAGGFGVDLFLVLSAFLITSLLLREQDGLGTIRVGAFYVRRMLRIWPLYLAFLALMFVVSRLGIDGAGFQPIGWGYWVAFLALVGNWYTGLAGYPNGNIDPLWSVSLEEQFYLFWPWLLLLFRRRLVGACIALFGLSVLARLYVVSLGLVHPAMWVFTVTRLDPIVLGALLAIANRRKLLPSLRPAVQWTLFIGGFAAWPVAHALSRMDDVTVRTALLTFPLAAFASAGILLAAVVSTGPLRALLMSRWVVRMGSLSYGTYVLHYFTLNLTSLMLRGQAPLLHHLLYIPIAFGLAWGLAEVSYRWLESPFLQLRSRFRSSTGVPAASASAVPAAAQSLQDGQAPGKGR